MSFSFNVFSVILTNLLLACACQPPEEDAQRIVSQSIQAHGGEHFDHAIISFRFRDMRYTVARDGGLYAFHRYSSDSAGQHQDVLSNAGFVRQTNDLPVDLSAEWQERYAQSVNSVVYFALLPYRLNDAAVHKKLLGERVLDGKPYYKILVTFSQEGGGQDHDDQFVYWINKDTYITEYIAYSFTVNGGGVRFRKAINPRRVGALLFHDYLNYKPMEGAPSLHVLDSLYEKQGLNLLSEIRLEDIAVETKEAGWMQEK